MGKVRAADPEAPGRFLTNPRREAQPVQWLLAPAGRQDQAVDAAVAPAAAGRSPCRASRAASRLLRREPVIFRLVQPISSHE